MVRALTLFIYRDSMELIATPRASAIPSISGAAVPEEILSMRVHAHAQESTRGRRTRAMQRGALECGTRTRCGKYTCQDPSDPENGERKSDLDKAKLGGGSLTPVRWKKVRKVKSEVNY